MRSRIPFSLILIIALIKTLAGWTFFGKNISAAPPVVSLTLPTTQVAEGRFPFTFQGTILDGDGNAVSNSAHELTLAIYDGQDARTPLWSEKQTVFTYEGLFTIILGEDTEISPNIFSDNAQTWLGIRVDHNSELQPRVRMTYSPYAFHAVTADNIRNALPTAAQIATLRWYEVSDIGFKVSVGDEPSAIAFDGEYLWVANRGDEEESDDDALTKINPSTGYTAGSVKVGTNPVAIVFDGKSLWVANQDSDNITKFDINKTNKKTLSANGERPVALSFDGKYVWVLVEGSDSVVRYNVSTEKAVDEDGNSSNGITGISVGDRPTAIAFDGTMMWVLHSGNNNITRINSSTATVVDTLSKGDGQSDIVFDGQNMWVTDEGDDSVIKIRASDGMTLGRYDSKGDRPEALAFDGRAIWIANKRDDEVTKLKSSNGELIGTFAVGGSPVAMAFDGTDVWEVAKDDDQIIKK